VVASTSTPLTTSRRQPSKAQTILSPARIERHNDWIEAFFDSIGQTEKSGTSELHGRFCVDSRRGDRYGDTPREDAS
jgi:hypothetical protein